MVAAADRKLAVIGHFPDYLERAQALGARYFVIDPALWDVLDDDERWAANREFLDSCIAERLTFVLATPFDRVRRPSYYHRELEYLMLRGYRPQMGPDGWEMCR